MDSKIKLSILALPFFTVLIMQSHQIDRETRQWDDLCECAKLEAEGERDKCYKMMEELIAKMKQDEEKAEQNYKRRLKEEMEQYRGEHQEKLYREKRQKEEEEKKHRDAMTAGLLTTVLLSPVITPVGAVFAGACVRRVLGGPIEIKRNL